MLGSPVGDLSIPDRRGPGLFDNTLMSSPGFAMDPWLGLNATAASLYHIETALAPGNTLLWPRKVNNPEASLTSKVLYGQLMSYPAMLIDGRGCLPPFIFPQCFLDGKSVEKCRSQGN